MSLFRAGTNLKYRILSTVIDYAVFFLFVIFYAYSFGGYDGDWVGSVSGYRSIPLVLIWFIYFPVIESLNGQTWGHKLMGLKVVARANQPIDLMQSTLRRVFDPIDIILSFGIVGVLLVRVSRKKQRLGDQVAATMVVGNDFEMCILCNKTAIFSYEEQLTGKCLCPDCKERVKQGESPEAIKFKMQC